MLTSPADSLRFTPSLRDVERWKSDPVAFGSEVFPLKPWSRQAELLRLVAENDFVACKSGHKVGKSASLALLALWWSVTRPGSRVVLTAPANHQVENILWPEIRLLYAQARIELGGKLFIDPRKGLEFGDKWKVFGLTTDKPERIAGLSGDKLMFLVDEASGYPEDIMTAVQGNLAGGGKLVLTGNPTQTSGTFFNAFKDESKGRWKTITISSLETPNFRGERIPGLADPPFAEWAKGEWGEDSPLYDVRLRGEFPRQASNSVIGLGVIEAAFGRWETTAADGPLNIGVDVARFGDDSSVIVVRRGFKVLEIEHVVGQDTVAVADKVLRFATSHRQRGERPSVKVDVIGVGAGVADILRMTSWLDVSDVNVAEVSDREEDYPDLRSQIWFDLGDWLKAGGALPKDSKLEGELAAPMYVIDPKGRRRVEQKKDIKKRIGRSPDRADALALAVLERSGSTPTNVDLGTARWNQDERGWG